MNCACALSDVSHLYLSLRRLAAFVKYRSLVLGAVRRSAAADTGSERALDWALLPPPNHLWLRTVYNGLRGDGLIVI
jgi:hypothetical protein